jgi:hypothetical protein
MSAVITWLLAMSYTIVPTDTKYEESGGVPDPRRFACNLTVDFLRTPRETPTSAPAVRLVCPCDSPNKGTIDAVFDL